MNRSEAGKLGWEKTREQRELKHRKFVESYCKNPKKCKLCEEIIPYKKRDNDYCSRSCSTAYNNGRRGSNLKVHPCKVCGINIVNRRVRLYCSHACRAKDKWIIFKREVEVTGVFPIKDDSTGRRLAKKYLIELNGHKCQICGITEWTGSPVPLVLDHINGNAEDNRFLNLRVICGNCSMLLPTFAGRNIGQGRAWRRKRYALGLSI